MLLDDEKDRSLDERHGSRDASSVLFFQSLRGALSTNTERAMRSDLAIFAQWCDAHGENSMPASPDTLAAFVDAMAETRAPATVRRYVSSIGTAHRASNYTCIARSEPVKTALKRMHRSKGRRQEQAEALNCSMREHLLSSTGDSLVHIRNRAILTVAYDTLLRRSELVALQVGDVVEETDGSATVLVRRSKTDPEGRGAELYLAPDSLEYVQEWLERSGIDDGNLFRSLARGRIGTKLGAGEIPRIFKRMAHEVGVPSDIVERISGHSTRIGAAQDMVAEGISMPAILQAGRWKNPGMVVRYSERLLAKRNGAAQLARVQRRA